MKPSGEILQEYLPSLPIEKTKILPTATISTFSEFCKRLNIDIISADNIEMKLKENTAPYENINICSLPFLQEIKSFLSEKLTTEEEGIQVEISEDPTVVITKSMKLQRGINQEDPSFFKENINSDKKEWSSPDKKFNFKDLEDMGMDDMLIDDLDGKEIILKNRILKW